MPYGNGNYTYCVRIAKVAFFFSIFQIVFIITPFTAKKRLHDFTAKKLHGLTILFIGQIFFNNLHDLPQKKIQTFRKNYTLWQFFLFTGYIFHFSQWFS